MKVTYEEFEEVFGHNNCIDHIEYYSYYHNHVYFYYNADPSEEGWFDLTYKGNKHVYHLEDYFKHPLYPTQEECILFKMDKGYDYLILSQ